MRLDEIMGKLAELGSEQTKKLTALHSEAVAVAEKIGKVHVNVGQTACKVPLATDYIKKMELRDKIGVKRKTCIC